MKIQIQLSTSSSIKSTSGSNNYVRDLDPLMNASNETGDDFSPEVQAAFRKCFGIAGSRKGCGIGSSNMDEGVYYVLPNGNNVNLMYQMDSTVARMLGVPASAKYVVYTDSYADEGPYLGNPDVVGSALTFSSYAPAKAAFIKMIKNPL